MMEDANERCEQPVRIVKAEINAGLIEKHRGTVSLSFGLRKHKRIAVKIVDDLAIESLKLLDFSS